MVRQLIRPAGRPVRRLLLIGLVGGSLIASAMAHARSCPQGWDPQVLDIVTLRPEEVQQLRDAAAHPDPTVLAQAKAAVWRQYQAQFECARSRRCVTWAPDWTQVAHTCSE